MCWSSWPFTPCTRWVIYSRDKGSWYSYLYISLGHHQGLRVDVDADLPHRRQRHRAGSRSCGAMTRLLAAAAGSASLALDNPGQAAGPDSLDPCPDRAHRLAEAASPSPRMRPDGDPSMQWGEDERYLNIPCIRKRR